MADSSHRSPASASSSPAPPAWSADRSRGRSPPTTPCSAAPASRTRRRAPSSSRRAPPRSASTSVRPTSTRVPDDLDYVLNFAVARSNDWEADFAANVEGVALLMERCTGVDAFFQCSTAGVYESQGQVPLAGDRAARRQPPRRRLPDLLDQQDRRGIDRAAHRVRGSDCPTVIARLSVPYGDDFGWPTFQLMMVERDIPIGVHPDRAVAVRAAPPRRHRRLAPLPARGGVGAGDGRELGRRRDRGRRGVVRADRRPRRQGAGDRRSTRTRSRRCRSTSPGSTTSGSTRRSRGRTASAAWSRRAAPRRRSRAGPATARSSPAARDTGSRPPATPSRAP